MKNITTTISTTTNFMQNCLTSTQATQIYYSTYIASFASLTDYMIAFLMNLTSNILTIYNVYQNIVTASSTCDFGSMATNLGRLASNIYTVSPVQQEAILKPLDLTHTPAFMVAEMIFQGFRSFVIENGKMAAQSFVDLDDDLVEINENTMDELYQQYYEPAHDHTEIDYESEKANKFIVKPIENLISRTFTKRNKVQTNPTQEDVKTTTSRSKSFTAAAHSLATSPPPPPKTPIKTFVADVNNYY